MTVTAAQSADNFAFTASNRAVAERHIAKYPTGNQQSAVMPLLTLAQEQNGGWLSRAAMDHVAEVLGMAPMRVYEVATFYTMYRTEPVGKFVVEVCTTTPCMLRGSGAIVEACKKHLRIDLGETTKDGLFTLHEVECLGACVNAPMMQIGREYFEDLTPQNTVEVLKTLARGDRPKPGPQSSRHSSEPATGLTTLKG
ncbi:MAG: NADH-quinone oxidoreductase subunit NuoE [Candidatus Pacebacteria bacterium]|nr:NADH-quinone oxidoreductase subunit NuoE [Candidatus Paceibacterota bacterium]